MSYPVPVTGLVRFFIYHKTVEANRNFVEVEGDLSLLRDAQACVRKGG